MGNNKSKEKPGPDSGSAEAQDVCSKTILIISSNGNKHYRNIFLQETAHDLLEALYEGNFQQFSVVICLANNQEKIMGLTDDFTEYWDTIEQIKIVPAGSAQNKPAEVEDLNKAIKYKG